MELKSIELGKGHDKPIKMRKMSGFHIYNLKYVSNDLWDVWELKSYGFDF